jgi:hypothetical protein
MLIKVNAENDIETERSFLGFYPEGYDDGGEILRNLRRIEPEAYPSINITPKEYKRLKGLVA